MMLGCFPADIDQTGMSAFHGPYLDTQQGDLALMWIKLTAVAFCTRWNTSMSSRVMLLPDGEGTRFVAEGDGVLGLFLLPKILVSLLPALPLACLLKLSTCRSQNHQPCTLRQRSKTTCSAA